MRTRLSIGAGVAALALALGACAGSDGEDAISSGDAAAEETSEAGGAAGAAIRSGETDLGSVLVDAEGFTLYGFTEDTEGVPTCDDACADAWPPVIVDGPDLPAGLDAEVFSVVERPDGTFQLKAGDWPLYLFAGDDAAGDTNGQGSGDVWFAVAPDGSLVRGASSSPTTGGDGY
jgi:predicted lipoprotein with Yx(FWY)xxD motif